jgi:hypothetical protein
MKKGYLGWGIHLHSTLKLSPCLFKLNLTLTLNLKPFNKIADGGY